MERNHRRILEGKVVSDKCDKTITVLVKRYQNHPIYKKRVLLTKKYIVHDEKQAAKLGDYVAIMECRPLSARKRFTLSKILKSYEDKNSKIVSDGAENTVDIDNLANPSANLKQE